MLAGGAELGLVHGRLHSPLWRLTWPLAFVVSGAAFIIHEQNSWFFARSAFLHHTARLDVHRDGAVPARARLAPAVGRAACRLRADDRRSSRCSSSPTVTSRPSSGTSRRSQGRRTGETPLARRRSLALAFPAAASAHATLRSTSPQFRRRSSSAAPRADQAPLRPARGLLPGSLRVLDGSGATTPARRASTGRRSSHTSRALQARRLHGALARDLGRLARRLGRVDVRRARARAARERGLRRRRPDHVPSTSCAGCGSSASRSRSVRSACA